MAYLEGDDSDKFEIVKSPSTTLAKNVTGEFEVQLKEGLPAGVYSTYITLCSSALFSCDPIKITVTVRDSEGSSHNNTMIQVITTEPTTQATTKYTATQVTTTEPTTQATTQTTTELTTQTTTTEKTGISSLDYRTQQQIADKYKELNIANTSTMTFEIDAREGDANNPAYAGKLSSETLKNALNVMNYIRYVAGVENSVSLNDEYNTYAQDSEKRG